MRCISFVDHSFKFYLVTRDIAEFIQVLTAQSSDPELAAIERGGGQNGDSGPQPCLDLIYFMTFLIQQIGCCFDR